MKGQAAGLRFRETMAGALWRGEFDYLQGERLGRGAGETLAMHAHVTIDDMQAFIADPAHAASLGGSIDYTPFGNAIECHRGSFNLFAPGGSPRSKAMIYQLGFVHDGGEYFLSGHKVVRDDPGFDLWRDTTTLFTRLYEGSDTAGTVLAAGVLTLGVAELVRLVASMEVTNARSVAQKAATLESFGRFFMGELWDSYRHHSR
jgi:hypothetical protein